MTHLPAIWHDSTICALTRAPQHMPYAYVRYVTRCIRALCVLAICARDMTHSYVRHITQLMHTCAILLIRLPYDTTQPYVRSHVRHSTWRMHTCAILLNIPICMGDLCKRHDSFIRVCNKKIVYTSLSYNWSRRDSYACRMTWLIEYELYDWIALFLWAIALCVRAYIRLDSPVCVGELHVRPIAIWLDGPVCAGIYMTRRPCLCGRLVQGKSAASSSSTCERAMLHMVRGHTKIYMLLMYIYVNSPSCTYTCMPTNWVPVSRM